LGGPLQDALAQRRAEREDRRADRVAGAKPKENAAIGKAWGRFRQQNRGI